MIFILNEDVAFFFKDVAFFNKDVAFFFKDVAFFNKDVAFSSIIFQQAVTFLDIKELY